jgi:two-component system, OmpR family, catabolic regulation response regulator CreB
MPKPLILLIEDEPGIADTLQYALRTDGFEPLWCHTAAQGLQQARAHAPDLVLLDVGLPDLNGFEVFKQLRSFSDVPVMFLTARSDEIDRVVGLELGADDYVTKPFSPRELVARVKTVLRRTQRGLGQVTAVPQDAAPAPSGATNPTAPIFAVDPERRSVRFYGQLLELSRYEYGLLKTLVARPGVVYTRDQLLDLVWDDATESIDRTVDAHVKTVRAKLRAVAPTLDPIRTHRGTGYALAEDLPSALPASP